MAERDYRKIEKEMELSGFFSEYLPPCFRLDRRTIQFPPPSGCDLIPPLSFTMSRYNGNNARRTIFIPEIGSYLAAHQYMNNSGLLKKLIEYTETDAHSFSHILDDADTILLHEQAYGNTGEDALSSTYISNIGEKIIRAAGAAKILKLDISNCYSSFYMHMIPAIFMGAEEAEREHRKYVLDSGDPNISEEYRLYKKLDEAIRRQNMNRTNGLLPGILSSKIIAEAILARVDEELEAKGLSFVRYVDDYEFFIYTDEERTVISKFTEVLRKYDFSINAEKTEIVDFPFYITKNFDSILHSNLAEPLTVENTINLFNTFFELEKIGERGAIRYLLKSFEQRTPDFSNRDLYKAYLLTTLTGNERSLVKSCSLLIASKDTLALDENDVKRLRAALHFRMRSGHDLETLWLLYLLIETGNLCAGSEEVNDIQNTENELTQALLLRRDILTPSQVNSLTEKATSWLLLYELYAADAITEETFIEKLGIKKNADMYKKFKTNCIHFVT